MRTTSFLVAIMAIAITACDKESFTPAIPSIDRSLYTEFSEPAEKVETFTAVLGDKELSVIGITVSHSHYNDLTFKAVVKDINSGSVTNVTDKATWHIPAIYSMRATKGIVKSNYKEITTLRKGYDGEIPEYGVLPAESGLMKVSYNGLEVNIPLRFQRTINVFFELKTQKSVVDNEGWKLSPVASYPLPFSANIVAYSGYSGTITWYMNEKTTTTEFLLNPNHIIRDKNEAEQSKVVFKYFNDVDSSAKMYVESEKTTYYLR